MFESYKPENSNNEKQEVPVEKKVLSDEERIQEIKKKIAEINNDINDFVSKNRAFSGSRAILTRELREDQLLKEQLEEELRNITRRRLITTPNENEGVPTEDSENADEDKLKEVMKKIQESGNEADGYNDIEKAA